MFSSAIRVYMILGGFYLFGMSRWEIEKIVNELKAEGVKKVAPCHCSGDLSRRICKKLYGDDCILVGAGKRLELVDAFPTTTINNR